MRERPRRVRTTHGALISRLADFTRIPLDKLSDAQMVELFRIITAGDFQDMQDKGVYSFYRIGIGPDGTWHFFEEGD